MQIERTASSCFDGLIDYPFQPHYSEIMAEDGTKLRMHYLDEGDPEGPLVLCLHGQPTWSYLYRKMIPGLVAAGCRVIAPDLIGFGKSDKPVDPAAYSYSNHVDWMESFLMGLGLQDINLFCQDWGGLIGLRVVAKRPELFQRVITSNTGLIDHPGVDGDAAAAMSAAITAHYDRIAVPGSVPEMIKAVMSDNTGLGFLHWRKYCAEGDMNAAEVLGTLTGVPQNEAQAYSAPFPTEAHKQGMRRFPSLVPVDPTDVAIADNRAAWKALEAWQKPWLTLFSDNDPFTKGREKNFESRIPGAKGQPHTILKGPGHFLQEEAPNELIAHIVAFMGL